MFHFIIWFVSFRIGGGFFYTKARIVLFEVHFTLEKYREKVIEVGR